MRRFVSGKVFVLAAILASAAGCGGSSGTTTTPTTPTPISVTEEFTGTLGMNAAASFPFTVSAAGLITATLTTLGPDSTIAIGLSLGTWNGTACAVSGIHNDNAGQGVSVIGQATASGTLCVRLADVGKVTDPIAYTVTVVHP